MKTLLLILLSLSILYIGFSETWFDGLYINSKIEEGLSPSNDQYWQGELCLIKAEKEMINFFKINNLNFDPYNPCKGIYLYRYSINNGKYEVWLRKRVNENYDNVKPIITGLVIIISKNNIINVKPKIIFEDGFILKSFCSIPPFFKNTDAAIKSNIVGSNPMIVKAMSVSNGNIILNNIDKEKILNASKVFNFIKFNRIIFLVK